MVARGRCALGLGSWDLGFASRGCAKAQAQSSAGGPPLDVPGAACARAGAGRGEPEIASAAAATELPAAAAPRRDTPATAGAREPRTRRRPTGLPRQRRRRAAAEPPRELRPASPAATPRLSAKSRDTLTRAARDLGRVDYGKLNRRRAGAVRSVEALHGAGAAGTEGSQLRVCLDARRQGGDARGRARGR